MRIETIGNKDYVNDIVEIHMSEFKGFFLTFLGKGFLKTLYQGFIDYNKSGLIIAFENETLVGFCAYSEDLSGFYKYLLKKRFFSFFFHSTVAFLRRPQIAFRLLRAFNYSKESKRVENYIELSSIGVSSNCKNKGVGSKMIVFLCENFRGKDFDYIKLETDKENNELANYFYQKNGFLLHHSYETVEGRKMNEYRYYLRENEMKI